MEERRPPSVPVACQRQIIVVPLHPDDDRAEAGPRIKPGVERNELADRLPPLEEGEAEGGDEEGAATIHASATATASPDTGALRRWSSPPALVSPSRFGLAGTGEVALGQLTALLTR